MKGTTTALVLTSTTAAVSAFSVVPHTQQTSFRTTKTELYGLFDGVKDAFTQPPSSLEAERETPIDRWMGWSVVSENDVKEVAEPVGTFSSVTVDEVDFRPRADESFCGCKIHLPHETIFFRFVSSSLPACFAIPTVESIVVDDDGYDHLS
jgi:hypothetical protein